MNSHTEPPTFSTQPAYFRQCGPLGHICLSLPFSAGRLYANFLNPSPRVLGEVTRTQSRPPSPTPCPISHSAPATQASLQFPKHTGQHRPPGLSTSRPSAFISIPPLRKCLLCEADPLTIQYPHHSCYLYRVGGEYTKHRIYSCIIFYYYIIFHLNND